MKLAQIVGGNAGWRSLEQGACRRRLRKCDHVAKRRRAGELHRDTVETESDTAVWRRSGPKSLQQEAEARVRRRFVDSQEGEDSRLQCRVADSNATSAELRSVQYHVVRLCAHRLRCALEPFNVGW